MYTCLSSRLPRALLTAASGAPASAPGSAAAPPGGPGSAAWRPGRSPRSNGNTWGSPRFPLKGPLKARDINVGIDIDVDMHIEVLGSL